jgi:hypothetical protein
MPNPKRPSNPFTPSPEPDWVDVQRMGSNAGRPEPPPARGSQRSRTVDFNGSSTAPSSVPSQYQGGPQNPHARKLIVPAFPTHATQTSQFDGNRDALDDLRRTTSNASTRSLPIRPGHFAPPPAQGSGPQVLRKPAPPPIPSKKPALLSKNSSQTMPPQSMYRDDPSPPPRRSMADRKPVGNGGFMDEEAKPPLPPRTGTGLSGGSGRGRNLMDDEPEDLGSLRGWEVLQPGR